MKIYVGNLSYEATDEDLETAFGPHGEIASVNVIVDRYSGRSRGFGFVDMPNDTEGEAAIEALNGQDFKGRPLTVNQARPRENSGDRGGSGGGGGGFGGGSGGGGGGGGGGFGRRW